MNRRFVLDKIIFSCFTIVLASLTIKNDIVLNLFLACLLVVRFYFQINSNIGNYLYSALDSSFLMLLFYFLYTSFCIFQYLIDGGVPRVSFFEINDELMLKYSVYNVLILAIYTNLCVWCRKKQNLVEKYKINSKSNIGVSEFIILAVAIYIWFCLFRFGTTNWGDALLMHMSLDTSSIMYISIVGMMYFLVNIDHIFSIKSSLTKSIFVSILAVVFWVPILLVGRRIFFDFIIMFVTAKGINIKKHRNLLYLSIAILGAIILFIGLLRNGVTLHNNLNDIIYYMFIEFILVGYTSIPFLSWNGKFLYGRTYFVNVIYSFIPKILFHSKPENLGLQFKKMFNLNVGFAFNPFSEALWNFSDYAVVITPLILFFYIKVCDRFKMKNSLLYILMLGNIAEFCRGTMPTFIFQLVFQIVCFGIFKYMDRIKLVWRR